MATFERMLLAKRRVIIAEKYNVIRKIGGGSFGDIFLAININDGEVNCGEVDVFFVDRFALQDELLCQRGHVFREFSC